MIGVVLCNNSIQRGCIAISLIVAIKVRLIGACNTIVNKSAINWHNTDVEGFFYPLRKKQNRIRHYFRKLSASKAVLYQCAKEGIKTIYLVARNHSRSDAQSLEATGL